jgi:4-amino-4-deoxy-L-arabinose transferase-like glycosyltransferase
MSVDFVQKLIHRLEVGGGLRYLRIGSGVLALLLVVVIYNWRGYRNLATLEAMDSAQLARNIALGKGYTTLFIRPLSIYLVSKHCSESQTDTTPSEFGAAATESPQPATSPADMARLKGMHPDLANPPVYPLLLAGLMKLADLTGVLPLDYTIPPRLGPFWGLAGNFWWHPPDFFIAVFNELLFLAVVALTFLLARRLFDRSIVWLSALLLLGTELFWKFSVSGLSTMLLLLIFMALAWCLTLLEAETREPRWGFAGFFVFAALAGLLVGLGSLTRYSFAWLILPVLVFVILLAEQRQRILVAVITFVAFALVLTPWVVRNYSISGEPFGTASFAFVETSKLFHEHNLQRSLEPDLNQSASLGQYLQNLAANLRQKLAVNIRQLITNDLPKLGGTWVSALFVAGLLVRTPNPASKRLRYFLIASLVVLVFVQALGHTQLSEDSPEINSENLLVLLGPLVLIYGISFFHLLLDQIDFPFRELRYVAIGAFGLVACLPLLLTFLQPKISPITYPPYYPPQIQSATDWTKEDELMMSDIPWAVAWYGQRQCVWLTLNMEKDFFAINDYRKTVQAIFLVSVPTTERTIGRWLSGGGWGQFIVACVANLNQGLPGGIRSFPLNFLQDRDADTKRWRGDRFLLTYRERPVKTTDPSHL